MWLCECICNESGFCTVKKNIREYLKAKADDCSGCFLQYFSFQRQFAENHLHQVYYTLRSASMSPVVDIFLIGHSSK